MLLPSVATDIVQQPEKVARNIGDMSEGETFLNFISPYPKVSYTTKRSNNRTVSSPSY